MGWYGNFGSRSEKLDTSIFNTDRQLVDGKRVKEVYKNHTELSHVWASGNVPRGVSGNMFFENGIIYSYGRHYKAAKIHTNKKTGEKLVLINNDSYSPSTGKHLSEIYGAVRHLKTLSVPDVSPENNYQHDSNVNFLWASIMETVENIFLLRTGFYGGLDSVKEDVEKLNLYLDIFGLKGKVDTKSSDFLETLQALKESIKIRDTKREVTRKKRDENQKKKNEELKDQYKEALENLEKAFPEKLKSWKTGLIKDEELRAASYISVKIPAPFGRTRTENISVNLDPYKAEIQAEVEIRFQKALKEWKEGKGSSINFSSIYLGGWSYYGNGGHSFEAGEDFAFLRVKGNTVETSQHANVPLDHAIRLLRKILAKEVKAGERVGHYTLESVSDPNKEPVIVKIGCHSILLSEAVEVLKPYMEELRPLKLVKE